MNEVTELTGSDAPESTQHLSVQFTGRPGEYFRIWIVNIALTVLTLGIYSAWAKVRTLRYFYSNTSIAGGHFDYHANPRSILIGRFIAVALFSIYYFGAQYFPNVSLLILLGVLLMAPWLLVRSRSFHMRNSSFNGIRFDFKRHYAGAFKVIYGGVAFAAVSLGLGTPSALFWRNQFVANNSAYGMTRFALSGTSTAFYFIYLKSIGIALTVFVLFGVFGAMFGKSFDLSDLDHETGQLVVLLPLAFFYLVLGVYVSVRQRNYVWNSLTLGNNRFLSDLSVRYMIWIYATNILAIVFTFGLMIPWAKIRLARYRADHLTVEMQDDPDAFAAANTRDSSAIGDEVGSVFDVDVDLAF
ncbi:MAG: YjgN family protein [Pseudomonadota bacterium]